MIFGLACFDFAALCFTGAVAGASSSAFRLPPDDAGAAAGGAAGAAAGRERGISSSSVKPTTSPLLGKRGAQSGSWVAPLAHIHLPPLGRRGQ